MKTKTCFKCEEEKGLDQFYTHPKMGDGHLNKCIDCTKAEAETRRSEKMKDPKWAKKERERHRLKALKYAETYSPDPASRKAISDRYREKYPEKLHARNLSSRIKCPKGCERHHWSYHEEHAKDVMILTIADHALLHRHIIYDQERQMYRDTNGILMDSKTTHIELMIYLNPKTRGTP